MYNILLPAFLATCKQCAGQFMKRVRKKEWLKKAFPIDERSSEDAFSVSSEADSKENLFS